jgi:hypothetical protein
VTLGYPSAEAQPEIVCTFVGYVTAKWQAT